MRPYINIAICDDDEKQLQINKYYVEQWAITSGQKVNIVTYPNSESFLFQWRYEEEFEIVLLDIRMGQMSGMDLAKHIREQDENIVIIFITGESSYVFDGYEVQALNYLMKPIKKEDMARSLDIAFTKHRKKEHNYFIVKKGKELLKVNYADILYFISFDHYLDMHTTEDVITFKEKIGKIEEELPQQQFCRCHRSYIVNLQYIENIQKNEIILDNGSRIPISKSRLNITYESFMDYFSKK